MRVSKHRSLSFGIGFLALLAMIMATSASAFATGPGGTISASIGTGTLTLTGASTTVAPLVLNGLNQSLIISMPMTVNDARGFGAGWNVSISATLFADATTHTLANNMTISSVTAAPSTNASGSTAPTSTATSPLLVTTTAQTMFNAAVNTGIGSFDLTPTTTVPVPPTTVPGIYTSVVTLALSSGP